LLVPPGYANVAYHNLTKPRKNTDGSKAVLELCKVGDKHGILHFNHIQLHFH